MLCSIFFSFKYFIRSKVGDGTKGVWATLQIALALFGQKTEPLCKLHLLYSDKCQRRGTKEVWATLQIALILFRQMQETDKRSLSHSSNCIDLIQTNAGDRQKESEPLCKLHLLYSDKCQRRGTKESEPLCKLHWLYSDKCRRRGTKGVWATLQIALTQEWPWHWT
jgi:hypothetical protein